MHAYKDKSDFLTNLPFLSARISFSYSSLSQRRRKLVDQIKFSSWEELISLKLEKYNAYSMFTDDGTYNIARIKFLICYFIDQIISIKLNVKDRKKKWFKIKIGKI